MNIALRPFLLGFAIDCAWIRTQHWVVAARGGGLVLNLTVPHPGEGECGGIGGVGLCQSL